MNPRRLQVDMDHNEVSSSDDTRKHDEDATKTYPRQIHQSSDAADRQKHQQKHLNENERKGPATNQGETGSNTFRPRPNDVLLGRGRRFHASKGNIRMWNIVCKHKREYNKKRREEKKGFAEVVLDEILEDGTRFLRRIDDGKAKEDRWEEVERSVALHKVWHVVTTDPFSQMKAWRA